ncbi:response regulator [Paenibacillus sp. P25]|nr:response regulator [Paenibacillus sp. P25]
MLHLLIVDDEIHAVRGIKAGVAWEEMGFAQVHEAYNIRQAKEMFGAHRIDVLICDIEMPEGNGFELLTWVKEHSPETESLFLTCHAEFEYAQKAIQLGSLDYMLKPVRFPELETAVRKAIAKREKERDLIRFKETYNHYYRLWESYQPLFIERFWRELIQRSVPSRKEHILEIAAKQNIPYNGDMTFLPVLVSVQRWHKSLTLREEKIMEYALRNSLEELPVIQQYKGQIVQVKNGALLAVLTAGCEAGMDKSKLGAGFQEYIDACDHYFFCDLCCYIGSPSSIEEIPDRFDALTAMEARNVTQSNKAFFLSDQKPAYDTIPLPQMNGWAEMLKCGCTQALAAEIDSYLHAMKRMERLDAKLLRGFYEDFLQMIHHVLHSEGRGRTRSSPRRCGPFKLPPPPAPSGISGSG